MIRTQLFTVVAVGLVATGCSYNSTTQAVVPSGPLNFTVCAPASTETVSDRGAVPAAGLWPGPRVHGLLRDHDHVRHGADRP